MRSRIILLLLLRVSVIKTAAWWMVDGGSAGSATVIENTKKGVNHTQFWSTMCVYGLNQNYRIFCNIAVNVFHARIMETFRSPRKITTSIDSSQNVRLLETVPS